MKDEFKPKIRHILADGTEVKSIKGMVIPYSKETMGIYLAYKNLIESYQEKEARK